jgi:hypothetical protein
MKKYLLAIAMLVMAGTIAPFAGVATGVLGNSTVNAVVHDDEDPPAWAQCNISLDCLRF